MDVYQLATMTSDGYQEYEWYVAADHPDDVKALILVHEAFENFEGQRDMLNSIRDCDVEKACDQDINSIEPNADNLFITSDTPPRNLREGLLIAETSSVPQVLCTKWWGPFK